VAIIVANVDSGPGTGTEANFATVYADAAAAGITVVGYVSTDYAGATEASIEAQIADWYSFYGASLGGILFDEVAATTGNESYYTALVDYVHTAYSGIVVLNPGDIPAESYLSTPIGDIVIVCEDNYADFAGDAAAAPGWLFDYPSSRIGVTCNTCPAEADMEAAIALSSSAFNAKYVWVTADGDYVDEPPYFAAEVALLAGGGPSGDLTVTATQGGDTHAGTLLRVLVLDHAAVAGTPNTATQSGVAAHQAAITTTEAGSVVAGAAVNGYSGEAMPADAGTTFLDNVLDTANGLNYATIQNAATGTPGAETVGTDASYGGGVALLEVLPSGGSIAVDASSPAVADTTSGTAVTSPGFTPPTGTLLVALAAAGGITGDVTTLAVTDSYGLTWTAAAQANAAGQNYAGVWYAYAPAALDITTSSLPGATQYSPYSQSVTQTGGFAPFTWSISSGSLPAGLSLNPSSGAITGTPTGTGTSDFTVKVADAFGSTATQALSIDVSGASPGPPSGVTVVNQWAGGVFQPDTFTSMPAGAGSAVIPLNESTSVGGGTGIPGEGNWLFALVGWNAAAADAVPGDVPGSVIPAITICVGDDSRMWWRPIPPSPANGPPETALCRTAIWYQPNIVPPARVYVAPTGFCTGMSVLIVEVAGLGPWDEVTSPVNGSYAAPAGPETGLPMFIPAPAAQSFMIAAVTGPDAAAGTAVSGSGWTALQTVTTVNGTGDSSDTVLAAAYITTSGAGDVTGTCTSYEPMSGQILAVAVTGATPAMSPNPWWPTLVFEAAFGGGFWTPPDQMTWTNLQSPENGRRLRSWSEETGPQYELGELESSEIDLVMDNPDGWLSPFNPESPFFPAVIPGTPVRIRAIPPSAGPGGYSDVYTATYPGPSATSPVNRWYVWQRNMERWPQAWDTALRGIVNGTATDAWSVINKTLPTVYRAEILNDLPYAWWPCDDSGASNATTLVNAAPGNDSPLTITTLSGPAASIDDFPFTSDVIYSAVTAFGQSTGWMYGDPDSAAFGQSGNGNADYGYYLSCHDENFPQLGAPGVTIEGWWNADAYDADGTAVQVQGLYGQPDGAIIIWQLASSVEVAPVTAQLYLSAAGSLIFATFDGGSAAETTLIGGDLRDGSWFGATVSMVVSDDGQGIWTAVVNGGQGGIFTGAPETWNTPFEWFYAMGSGGLSNTSQNGCGNFQVSHLIVFPCYLPAARVMAHHMAAYTGMGQLPSPVITAEFVSNPAADAYDPSGTQRAGTAFNEPGDGDSSLACVATAVCGSAYSGPSYPVQRLTVLPTSSPPGFCWASAGDGDSSQGSFAAPGYAWYTAGGNGSMKHASTGLAPWLYVNGYGSGATPPSGASPLGDTAQARVERLLQAGLATGPRCIDASQTAILAALDTGGQPCGENVQNIAQSDGALLFVDNLNYLSYWDREHLEPSSAEPQVTILAPVYNYPPSSFWAAVEAAAPAVQYVIANVDSGPGSEAESNFATVFGACQAAGITVLGYVWTGYGSVSQATVEEQIGLWSELYGITSVLFDGVSSSAGDLSYYEAISSYARLHGASAVVLDCGTIPDESYMSLSDVVVVFEGTAASFGAFSPPSWAADYPASQMGAVIYAASGEPAIVSLVAQLQADNIGVTFITDATAIPAAFTSVPGSAGPGRMTPGSPLTQTSGTGNPYGVLPSYWDDEVSVIAATAPQSASATWMLGPNVAAGQIPFDLPAEDGWDTDPQQVRNDIAVTQYDTTEAGAEAQAGLSTGSAESAGGLVYAPAAQYYAGILASQEQYGDCGYQITSYLQSTDEIQSQCNWLFENYGVARQRITGLTVNAAAKARTCPMAWVFALGANVGDIVSATQSMPGQPSFQGTWRVTHLSRKLDFAAGEASCTITADYLPPTYWS
jgi:hypothetical protein